MRRSILAPALLVIGLAGALPAGDSVASPPFKAFPISVTDGHELSVKVDGRYVVWTDVAFLGGPPNSTNDVYAYDLLLGQRFAVATGPGQQDEPSVSGNTVIWTTHTPGTPQIIGRNLATGAGSFTVTAGPGARVAHAISGELVVWQNELNGTPQVWGRRLGQPIGSDFAVSRTDVLYGQVFPDVSGGLA